MDLFSLPLRELSIGAMGSRLLVFIHLLALAHTLPHLNLPHNISSSIVESRNGTLISATADSSREPSFMRVVLNGYNVAQIMSKKPSFLPIRKVINKSVGLKPSNNLDDFMEIELELVASGPEEPWFIRPFHTVKVKNNGWNAWLNAFDQGNEIAPRIAHLGFNLKDVMMDESRALETLSESGEAQKWNVIQLCKSQVSRQYIYAFADIQGPFTDQELVGHWDLVDANNGTITSFEGDPCSNLPIEPS